MLVGKMPKENKMKKYYEAYFVCGESVSAFLEKFSEIINNYQNNGYQVDIHYALSNGLPTALVLPYTEGE